MSLIERLIGRGPAAPPPAPSKRDMLAAEIELERHQLPDLDLLVRAGRRDTAELDAVRARIADLERQLETLDAEEIANVERDTRLRELMPGRLDGLREQLKEFHVYIEQGAQMQADLERTAAQFEQDFANERGCVPPVAHDLVAFCRTWSKELGPRSNKLTNYLKRFRRVALGEREPARTPSALELMTPDEREELAERQREKRRRS